MTPSQGYKFCARWTLVDPPFPCHKLIKQKTINTKKVVLVEQRHKTVNILFNPSYFQLLEFYDHIHKKHLSFFVTLLFFMYISFFKNRLNTRNVKVIDYPPFLLFYCFPLTNNVFSHTWFCQFITFCWKTYTNLPSLLADTILVISSHYHQAKNQCKKQMPFNPFFDLSQKKRNVSNKQKESRTTKKRKQKVKNS